MFLCHAEPLQFQFSICWVIDALNKKVISAIAEVDWEAQYCAYSEIVKADTIYAPL